VLASTKPSTNALFQQWLARACSFLTWADAFVASQAVCLPNEVTAIPLMVCVQTCLHQRVGARHNTLPVHVQDDYDTEYERGLRRHSTKRKQASMASRLDDFSNDERMALSMAGSLGPRAQSLAPFQVSLYDF
jgi:hypothetical protein